MHSHTVPRSKNGSPLGLRPCRSAEETENRNEVSIIEALNRSVSRSSSGSPGESSRIDLHIMVFLTTFVGDCSQRPTLSRQSSWATEPDQSATDLSPRSNALKSYSTAPPRLSSVTLSLVNFPESPSAGALYPYLELLRTIEHISLDSDAITVSDINDSTTQGEAEAVTEQQELHRTSPPEGSPHNLHSPSYVRRPRPSLNTGEHPVDNTLHEPHHPTFIPPPSSPISEAIAKAERSELTSGSRYSSFSWNNRAQYSPWTTPQMREPRPLNSMQAPGLSQSLQPRYPDFQPHYQQPMPLGYHQHPRWQAYPSGAIDMHSSPQYQSLETLAQVNALYPSPQPLQMRDQGKNGKYQNVSYMQRSPVPATRLQMLPTSTHTYTPAIFPNPITSGGVIFGHSHSRWVAPNGALNEPSPRASGIPHLNNRVEFSALNSTPQDPLEFQPGCFGTLPMETVADMRSPLGRRIWKKL